MRRLVFRLLLLATIATPGLLPGGTPIRLNSPQISIQVGVPDGWTVDVRSAFQLAQFILHERGTNWRDADLVVFGRFVRRAAGETQAQFLESEEKTYIGQCPLVDIEEVDLKIDGPADFLIKRYTCPGTQQQLVALTETPHSFVVFVLAAHGVMPLEVGHEPFREILSDFRVLRVENQPPEVPPSEKTGKPSGRDPKEEPGA